MCTVRLRRTGDRYYGAPPLEVLSHHMRIDEYCFYQYLPVKMGVRGDIRVPRRLRGIQRTVEDIEEMFPEYGYIYLTVKYGINLYNRPGWHTDGFGTDDLNFIYSDVSPTIFNMTHLENVPEDHDTSLLYFQDNIDESKNVTFGDNRLILVDKYVVHRTSEDYEGERLFVKISLSNDIYNLKGNSHNYLFNYKWDMEQRDSGRNCPIGSDKEKR